MRTTGTSHWIIFPMELSCLLQRCMHVCTRVHVCVGGILMTIPIHICDASIWILLPEHMSGKSRPGNRIQAQMMSFYVELTCHLSDSPRQVKAPWGHAHTQASCWSWKRNKQTVTCIELHMTRRVSWLFQFYVRNEKNKPYLILPSSQTAHEI